MPRSNRYILPGYLYHVTHRCHDRKFLFAAGLDRNAYRRRLRDGLERFGVSLLSYAITCNHTHQILTSQDPKSISRMMQTVEGKFAEHYNERKRRSGAFWEDRFHTTMIQDGMHLLNCMLYIDLNMVRARVVDHPAQWEWCGYHEIVGSRRRYRILDHDLLRRLLGPLAEGFSKTYADEIQAAIAKGRLKRESWWTESVAVGSREYVRRIEELTRKRKKRIKTEDVGNGVWCVREELTEYGAAESALEPEDEFGP
jgi:putative transposase